MKKILLTFFAVLVACQLATTKRPVRRKKGNRLSRHVRPNFLFILADDLGYNDVSWHNPEVPMPTLDRLAKEGVIMESHYTNPVCSPSRAAFLTGKYPFRTGRQEKIIMPFQPTGLSLNVTTLPQELLKLGYQTHMAGKWHLGFCANEYLPTRRGFQTFLGIYNGAADYYSHTRMSGKYHDFFDGERPAREYKNKHSSIVYGDRAVEIINDIGKKKRKSSKDDKPFFMYLAFQNPHTVLQPTLRSFKRIKTTVNQMRDVYAALVLDMDFAVQNVMRALKKNKLYENTIIVFTSDNGGPIKQGASNWPLRGNKNTLFEGGTRVPTFVHAPHLLKNPSYVNERLMHMVDWMPTFLNLAGFKGNPSLKLDLDGIDQWNTISKNISVRTEMVYNINHNVGAIRMGDYKIIFGLSGRGKWCCEYLVVAPWLRWIHSIPGVSERKKQIYKEHYTMLWERSKLRFERDHPSNVTGRNEEIQSDEDLYEETTVSSVGTLNEVQLPVFNSSAVYLFNLRTDPNEQENIRDKHPEIVEQLKARVLEYFKLVVPEDGPPEVDETKLQSIDGVIPLNWCQAKFRE